MRGGGLHNPIEIQVAVDTPDPAGGAPTIVWKSHSQAFAEVKSRMERPTYEGGRRFQQVQHEFFVRFFDVVGVDLNEPRRFRVLWEGRAYRIIGMTADHERKNWSKIIAEHIAEDSRVPA